jgi:NADPH:quinone reductase
MATTDGGYRAFGYPEAGGPEVLREVRRPHQPPGPGEVRVEVARSGINPTDVKARRGPLRMPVPEGRVQVPHHDASGTVVEVGAGVTGLRTGQRVWTHLAAYRTLDGTAAESVTLPAERVAPLPDNASHELGAALGVPFLTAHRLLTLGEHDPDELSAGALAGRSVLVTGGAGAVGNAAIQLASWAGATVLSTVSSAEKAALATAAGARHVINYRDEDVAARVREVVPDGVDTVVEVAPAVNAPASLAAVATGGAWAIYANDGGPELALTVQQLMWLNLQIGFVILYSARPCELAAGVRATNRAVAEGAVGVGPERGIPVHAYPLAEIAAAHTAVESAVVGKVQLVP